MHSDQIQTIAAPANNGDVYLYLDPDNAQPIRDVKRIEVMLVGDQVVTVFHEVKLPGGTTFRIQNGSGDASVANTLLDKEYVMKAGQNRIRIHAGATAPTAGTWECGARLIKDRASPT